MSYHQKKHVYYYLFANHRLSFVSLTIIITLISVNYTNSIVWFVNMKMMHFNFIIYLFVEICYIYGCGYLVFIIKNMLYYIVFYRRAIGRCL